MKRIFAMSRLLLVLFPGLLALASGYAEAQDKPRAQTGAAQPATPSGRPMEGCGMMVNGKMVYRDSAKKECMNMNKPAGMMPNGVTMHTDPGATPKQPK
jgi:hypothetical protein